MTARLLRRTRVLPGFGITAAITWSYLGLIVLLPLLALAARAATLSWPQFRDAVFSERALASYRLSFGASFAAAAVCGVLGLIVAWVLARYRFPGHALADALVDLPFALPTAVAGLTLTSLYTENGWLGRLLLPFGIKVAFTPLGVIVALMFVGLPFVVRSVQPVLEELDSEVEEAAATLGASRWQTFERVILPALRPALLSGSTLAFARALGEYGSIVFISGNLPLRTEIAPLLIATKLEQYDYAGATAMAAVLLLASFALFFLGNRLQRRLQR